MKAPQRKIISDLAQDAYASGYMPEGMTLKVEMVDPTTAAEWLKLNDSNRKMVRSTMLSYAEDMRNGRWTFCIDPITFYADGSLATGQHRLHAIILSLTKQAFLVLRGLPRSAALNVDIGRKRSVTDNARIAGLSEDYSPGIIACAICMEEGKIGSKTMSPAQKMAEVDKYRGGCGFAVKHNARTKRLGVSPVNAAVARAWYYESNKESLARFCKVLRDGRMLSTKDGAAIALRNYLLEDRNASASATPYWRDTFLKVQHCVWYFMRGKDLKKVPPSIDVEKYPLPSQERIREEHARDLPI